MSAARRILALQPYDGGSHRAMLQGWIANSRHDWKVLALPARHWKWRMRHSPIEFAAQTKQLDNQGVRFDAIFTTDMLNLAEFRGLAPVSIARLPAILYFHENQYAYPVQPNQKPDLHLSFTNLVSMLAADLVWFNSDFNRQSMREHIRQQESAWPDFVPAEQIDAAFARSFVQYPGIELPAAATLDQSAGKLEGNATKRPVHIVWAARWEHDKGPDELLLALNQLVAAGVEFRISVIGQTFREGPKAFSEIKRIHQERIVHWGYQESREAYWRVLAEADVFLSTAKHEFFGISAAEAIAAGCLPLLPDRLAYPELLNVLKHPDRSQFLYVDAEEDFYRKFRAITDNLAQAGSLSADFQQRFGWPQRARTLDAAIEDLPPLSP